MKKFELISEFVTNVFGKKLFRIKALVSFGDVSAGELGGFVEKEENLSNNGDALGLRQCAGLRRCRLFRRYRLWSMFPRDHIFPMQG